MSRDEAERGKTWVESLVKRLAGENGFEVTSAFEWHFDMDHYAYWMDVELNGIRKRWQFSGEKLQDCVNDRTVQRAIEGSLVQYVVPSGQPPNATNATAHTDGPSSKDEPFRWEEIDHGLAALKLQDLSEDIRKEIDADERRVRFENRTNRNAATAPAQLFEMHERRTDDWASRTLEVYRGVVAVQGLTPGADFLRAVYANAIRPLIDIRTASVTDEFQRFAKRTNYPSQLLSAQLKGFRRKMQGLQDRWKRRLEAEAREHEYASSRVNHRVKTNTATPADPGAESLNKQAEVPTYRELRLSRFFNNPGRPSDSVLGIGATGPACRNIRIALGHLGFTLSESDGYDQEVFECVRALQERERHSNVDGLTGPGTRLLLVRTLLTKSGERIFKVMASPSGDPFPLVFVSYAREDRPTAEKVVDFLKKQGVNVWVDYLSLRPGEKWASVIETAIPSARYFLALMSSHSLSKTGYVQKEVRTAWDVADRHPDSNIFIIPARLEPCEVHGTKFAQLHWIDLFPDIGAELKRLVDFLAKAD